MTPAVCEEALFRGPILRGLRTRFSPLGAALLTGILFGLFHGDIWRFVPSALLGVGLSAIALASDSIVPAMVAHFVNNACLLVLVHRGLDATEAKTATQAHATGAGRGRPGRCGRAAGARDDRHGVSPPPDSQRPGTSDVAYFTEFWLSEFGAFARTTYEMPSGEEKQTLALLRKCDVLSDISAEALQALLPGLTTGNYRPRQVIYLPGDGRRGSTS